MNNKAEWIVLNNGGGDDDEDSNNVFICLQIRGKAWIKRLPFPFQDMHEVREGRNSGGENLFGKRKASIKMLRKIPQNAVWSP